MHSRLTALAIFIALPTLVAACAGSTSTPPVMVSSSSTTSPRPASSTSTSSTSATASGSVPRGSATGTSAPPQSAVPAEQNPPGDIPDNLAFVTYANRAGSYRFAHPEGWAQVEKGSSASFTDKLNGVTSMVGAMTTPPTVSTAQIQDIPALVNGQPAFELRNVRAVTEPGGQGVLIVYRRNSAPDPVTGRQYRDEVQRYELVSKGHEVVLELYGPVGADNVDAYRTMMQSLRIS